MWELTVYAYRVDENYANEATKKTASLSLTVQEFRKAYPKEVGQCESITSRVILSV
jgi:hypothetical protein